jgi:hypothetical protein
MLLCSANANSAELRVSLKELAAVINPIVTKTSVRLHNVPSEGILGGIFDPNSSSHIRLDGTKIPLPFKVRTFPLTRFGSGRYAYYLNDINTESISLHPQSGALVLVIKFEAKDAELVGGCASGTCGFARALPIVQWRKPQVSFTLLPTRLNGGVSLVVSKVSIDGHFRTYCLSGSLLCSLGRSWAERYINDLKKRELPKLVSDILNTDENMQKIADQFSKFLSIGNSGRVAVKDLTVAKASMRLVFSFQQ